MKRKKMRKRYERLSYEVQVLELEQRLAELQGQRMPVGFQKRLKNSAIIDKQTKGELYYG